MTTRLATLETQQITLRLTRPVLWHYTSGVAQTITDPQDTLQGPLKNKTPHTHNQGSLQHTWSSQVARVTARMPSPPFSTTIHSLPFMPKSVKLLERGRGKKRGDIAWKGGREKERESLSSSTQLRQRFLLGSGQNYHMKGEGRRAKGQRKRILSNERQQKQATPAFVPFMFSTTQPQAPPSAPGSFPYARCNSNDDGWS